MTSITTESRKQLWYESGSYVTVWNTEGGWFLCRLQHNVYNTTKSVRIRWLTETGRDENEFRLDHRDEVDPAAILMNVQVEVDGSRYRLREDDRLETQRLIKVVDYVANGEMDVKDVDSDIDPVIQIEPPLKKRKMDYLVSISKTHKDMSQSELIRKITRKKDLASLHPNNDVKVWRKDPFFETKKKVPFVSYSANSKLLFRAVAMEDEAMLQKLLRDKQRIPGIFCRICDDYDSTPLHYALKRQNREIIKILAQHYFVDDIYRRYMDAPVDSIRVNKIETGRYNRRSLGVPNVRAITSSRGSKEGNNALIKDLFYHSGRRYIYEWELLKPMYKAGVDIDIFKTVYFNKGEALFTTASCNGVLRGLDLALERGHYKLAGDVIKCMLTDVPSIKRVTSLHYKVLLSEEEIADIRPKHVTHGTSLAGMITPLHCAACNPNPRHLEKLLEIHPDIHHCDKLNRRLVHFAAACRGPGPLKLIIQRGGNIHDTDYEGNTPLHYASRANREENIGIILEAAVKDAARDPCVGKYGLDGINRPNKNGYTPLHLAVENHSIDAIRLLAKKGANVDSQLTSKNYKLTPLVLAAKSGQLKTTMFLVKQGALVERGDRLKRTAVIHAAMNGNTNVLSYLLNLGASPTRCDSSGNSPLHYAAAYGWYFCVKTLLEAGADVNCSNNWDTTPACIAYRKGHFGIVTLLLDEAGADVNFKDEDGMTLVSVACTKALRHDLVEQVKYITRKGGLCTLVDTEGSTPMHHLARNKLFPSSKEYIKEATQTSVKIARLLLRKGCDLKTVNKLGVTAVMDAIKSGNLKLVKLLVQAGCPISPCKPGTDNLLHDICNHRYVESYRLYGDVDIDYAPVLKYIATQDGKDGGPNLKQEFTNMAQMYCDHGLTPLLQFCHVYSRAPSNRKLIEILVGDFNSDVDAVAREKQFKDGEKPEDERDRYHIRHGKWSVTNLLCSAYDSIEGKKGVEHPALRYILSHKPNINTEFEPPMLYALERNDFCVAEILVKESDPDITFSVLKMAAENVNSKLFDLMIDAGADLSLKDSKGNSLLHAVIASRKLTEENVYQVSLKLLDHGVAVDARNNSMRTPLHLAVDANPGWMDANFDLILALLDRGADLTARDVEGKIPFHYTFHKPKSYGNYRGKYRGTAPSTDPVELCRIVASRMETVDLNTQDKFGMTSLHYAAMLGADISCIYLIEKGADMNVKNSDGNTPLCLAVTQGHDSCGAVFIQQGANINDPVVSVSSSTLTNDKDTSTQEQKRVFWQLTSQQNKRKAEVIHQSLFECALVQELQAVCFLLMESGTTFGSVIQAGIRLQKYNVVIRLINTTADVPILKDITSEHDRHLLLHLLCLSATSFDSEVEKVAICLIEHGVSDDEEDGFKCTPLLYASLNHNYELCRFLIGLFGAYNPKHRDCFGRSTLAAAFWRPYVNPTGFTEWLSMLLDKGGDLNDRMDLPIMSDHFGDLEDEDEPEYWKQHPCARISPLIVSIYRSDQTLCQWLLHHGADVNLPDSLGRSPLMYAVRQNMIEIVKTLLNFDYNHNDPRDTCKPYQAAPKQVDKGCTFLLKRKSSRLSRNEDDDKPMDVDETEKQNEAVGTSHNKGEYQPFKKVSDVDLNAVDKNGWTAIHHAVCPLSFGTFDNDEMVFILAKAGAKLTVRNKKGETPLDLAVKNGAFRIARMIQELENMPKFKMKEPKFSTFKVSDGLKWKEPVPSFDEDAERMLGSSCPDYGAQEEYQSKIDSNCEVTNGSLVKDEEHDTLYDVLLTKVDVNQGVWGLYNFYQMQLVHQPGKNLFILFTRWGRIGDQGQFQHTPFKDREDARKEFGQIFQSKTGNKWTDVKRFKNISGKYRLVHSNERRRAYKTKAIDVVSHSSVKSKLPLHLQEIVAKMTDVQSLQQVLRRQDVDFMPLGDAHRDRLIKAKDLLDQIKVKVLEMEKYQTTRREGQIEPQLESDKDAYQINCEQVGILSSEYFQLIPQKDFVYELIRPLSSVHKLQIQMELLDNLLDYELTTRLLLGAKYRKKEMNPLDYVYRSVGCQFQLLGEDDQESQYILRYIFNSDKDAQVEGIYRVERDGEREVTVKPGVDNHHLLFHATRADNLLSILHKGLTADCGKGIRFTDTFQWCSERGDQMRFMLLCEVALGNCQVETSQHSRTPHDNHESLYIVATQRPVDEHVITLKTGCKIPLGKIKTNDYYNGQEVTTSNSSSEYIVFDNNHVRIRYLIQYSAL